MKQKKSLKKYMDGTPDTGVEKSPAGSGINIGLIQQIPGMLDNLMSILENNPKAYSKQPVLNASTMRNMVTPYAFGGDVEYDEEQLAQLQQLADENGITIEEVIQQIQQEQESGMKEDMPEEEIEFENGQDEEESEEFKYGGKAKKNGKNPFKRNRLNLPQNTKEWNSKYGNGGKVPIEVEDDEVLETPNGNIAKMSGATHEEGGIDVNVPQGTKIFSDRLEVDGKTMQERKLSRERAMKRIQKAVDKNPTDQLLKGTLKRTTEVHGMEEAKDMEIQKAVNAITSGEGFGYGGVVRNKYGFGDEVPYLDKMGWHYPKKKFVVAQEDLDGLKEDVPPTNTWHNTPEDTGEDGSTFNQRLNIDNPAYEPSENTPLYGNPNKASKGVIPEEDNTLGAGDYVGLFGNAFNAIAPFINTVKAARATKPNINRYLGFGRKALEDNDAEQGYVSKVKGNAMTDVNTSANASYARNRNSAQGVNTVRALDIATDMAKNKASNDVDNTFSNAMVGILDKRSQLHNEKDKVEMSGATARDTEDDADTDNFYSNMAQNLVNAGTNIQGLGRNINTAKSNRVNAKLISQLSQYGLGFDKNGKLITLKK